MLRETCKNILISCGCMLFFTNMSLSCKYASNGVSTWAKFDGHIYHGHGYNAKVSPLYNVL